MSNLELSMLEVVGQAYARALPPKKFVKLLQNRLGRLPESTADDDLAAALLRYLLPNPPSIILSYLAQALASSLVSSKAILVHILFYLSDNDVPTISALTSITNVLLSNPTGLAESTVIPSLLTQPFSNGKQATVPDIGTSASATPSPTQTSTLSLLIPLLRLCASTPSSSLSAIVGRTISLLAPFPAPSLDVGLEAGGLLPNLPEEIVNPLRNCLGELMADLSTHDMVGPNNTDIQMGDVSQLQPVDVGSVPVTTGDTPLPLRPTISFLLHQAHRSSKWSPSTGYDQPTPSLPTNYTQLIKIGSYLTSNPAEYLSVLLETCLLDVAEHMSVGTIHNVRAWQFVVEGIPRLFKWWKENSDPKWPIPTDLTTPLNAVIQALLPSVAGFSDLMTQTYVSSVQSAEAEDESSGFTPLEGWQLLSLQESLISKLVQFDIISLEEAAIVAPGVTVHTFSPGESLLKRLAGESTPHLPPLVQLIDYAYGAASSFAAELVEVIQGAPQIPPPENLFVHISSQPKLLTALSTYIPPPSLLDLLVRQLLNGSLDEAARADDPQGYLIRFGEGVMLIQTVVAHFELDLPDLLHDARRANNVSDLSSSHKECLNGWVRAIFGSDGIEDQILLATSPQELCKLTPTLIQQAIAAVASGQIDLDTLHSGLSYFSQPLLSWCLGGVIGWLCREIERQGLLSALHLVVLQDLVMGHACPEALLRVNAEGLNGLLEPTSGLRPVLESSGFDVSGVRNKLDQLGIPPVLPLPCPSLRSALQVIRQLEIAPSDWQSSLSLSLDLSLRSVQGPTSTVKDILDEIFLPSLVDLNGSATTALINRDTLVKFTPIIFALQLRESTPPLLLPLIRINIPSLFQTIRSAEVAAEGLTRIVKSTFHLAAEIWSEDEGNVAESLLKELVEEVEYEMSKPVIGAEELSVTGETGPIDKKRRMGRSEKITSGQKEVIEALMRGLRDDDDLRGRWGEYIGRLERLG
ncbi:hypothetical protein IAR55_007028 [Kwoniella newhampshirensis]|uniref:Mediator of RNA polymerase II transcription subunit 5 n=1 Tax=Kwoniella newhampshirensis TaxID=1651941 RepID=A0AAW0YFV4_9TREE